MLTDAGHAARDLQLTFGARVDVPTLTFATYACDDTVLVRGNTAITDATAATYVAQTGDSQLNCRVTAAGLTTSQSPSVNLTTQATGGTPATR